MPKWRIYYTDRVVKGETKEDWLNAPSEGVQVVVIMEPPDVPHRTYDKRLSWAVRVTIKTLVKDRQLIDGIDEYDPFGWGVKYGELIPDEKFLEIWEQACGD